MQPPLATTPTTTAASLCLLPITFTCAACGCHRKFHRREYECCVWREIGGNDGMKKMMHMQMQRWNEEDDADAAMG
ncbi:mini zinc finger 2 [Euphorbia peplus]|nr:mini zinc finger 2 [Euphorbia peplus]